MPPTSTTKTPPRKPQDRQPKKSDTMAADEQPPIGHDILKPAHLLRSGEQATLSADLYEVFDALGFDMKAAAEDAKNGQETHQEINGDDPAVIRAIGRLSTALEPYALDEDAFIKLDTGRGAMQRMMDLAQWYLAQLGESDSSAS